MKQIPFTADLLTMPVMQLAMLVQPLALPHPSEELIQVVDLERVVLSDAHLAKLILCNTKATSKQALLLHAEGKKHWAKARAFHASQQPPIQTDKPAPEAKDAVETASNSTAKDDKNAEQPKFQESSEQNNLNQGVNVMCSPALL
ncbi:protein transport protein Sec24 [Trifolium repens]|nr:protein transport protein Sec24 [Trifolium repens]